MRGIHRCWKTHPCHELIKPDTFIHIQYKFAISLHIERYQLHTVSISATDTQYVSDTLINSLAQNWFCFHKCTLHRPVVNERTVLLPQSKIYCVGVPVGDFTISISLSLYNMSKGANEPRIQLCWHWVKKDENASSFLTLYHKIEYIDASRFH